MAVDPLRVLLVDDHEVVRLGVDVLLATADDIEVCGTASTAEEAVRAAGRLRPDVIVMDAQLPDGSGIVATKAIRQAQPDARVLIYTAFDDDDVVLSAILAGAAGFVLKGAHGADLVDAIRQVGAGRSLLDPSITEAVLERLRHSRPAPTDERLARLSDRERDILDLVAAGRTNAEIAAQLHLSEKTVKNHLTRVLAKLGVSRRAEAAAYHHRHAARYDT